jgi:hypothetical protein
MTNDIQVQDERPNALAGKRGLIIKDFDELTRFSVAVFASGIAPNGHKNAQSVFVAAQMGAELGLPPMTAIQTIAVINGRPCIWGDGLWGICQASPLFDQNALVEAFTPEGDGASCTVGRIGGKPITRCFTIENAKSAGLLGKDNWKKYPRRMLQMRARMWACRDAFPDVVCGIRTAEEVVDDALGDPHSANTQRHIEQAKADRESEPLNLPPTLKEAQAMGKHEDPAPNPPTPEEVEQHEPKEVYPTPAEQEASADELAERIGAAVSTANVAACETSVVECVHRNWISQAQAAMLAELIAAARGRIG